MTTRYKEPQVRIVMYGPDGERLPKFYRADADKVKRALKRRGGRNVELIFSDWTKQGWVQGRPHVLIFLTGKAEKLARKIAKNNMDGRDLTVYLLSDSLTTARVVFHTKDATGIDQLGYEIYGR